MPKVSEEKVEKRLAKLKAKPKNKKLIEDFIADSKRGLTRKKVGTARRYKLIYILENISKMFGKDFEAVTFKDVEVFLDRLEDGKFGKYKESTKVDYRKVLKTFAKWMHNNKYNFPDVSNIDATIPMTEIPSLSKEEIFKIVDSCKVKDKAIIMVLFDSGARAEEFLNIKIKNLERVDGSNPYYKVRFEHEHSKTKGRTISLPLCTKYLDAWLQIHPEKDNPEAKAFPMSYSGFRLMIHRKGKIISKRIYPHLLRHSSATYYANKLSYFPFCYRYGWEMNSEQPKRYIDKVGIQGEEEHTNNIIKIGEVETLKNQMQKLEEEMGILQSNYNELIGKLHTKYLLKRKK